MGFQRCNCPGSIQGSGCRRRFKRNVGQRAQNALDQANWRQTNRRESLVKSIGSWSIGHIEDTAHNPGREDLETSAPNLPFHLRLHRPRDLIPLLHQRQRQGKARAGMTATAAFSLTALTIAPTDAERHTTATPRIYKPTLRLDPCRVLRRHGAIQQESL